MSELGGGSFFELQQAIKSKNITTEQVDILRDKLTSEMEAVLGPSLIKRNCLLLM